MFQLQWKIGNISDICLQYFVLYEYWTIKFVIIKIYRKICRKKYTCRKLQESEYFMIHLDDPIKLQSNDAFYQKKFQKKL